MTARSADRGLAAPFSPTTADDLRDERVKADVGDRGDTAEPIPLRVEPELPLDADGCTSARIAAETAAVRRDDVPVDLLGRGPARNRSLSAISSSA